jgi:hypothetical protein
MMSNLPGTDEKDELADIKKFMTAADEDAMDAMSGALTVLQSNVLSTLDDDVEKALQEVLPEPENVTIFRNALEDARAALVVLGPDAPIVPGGKIGLGLRRIWYLKAEECATWVYLVNTATSQDKSMIMGADGTQALVSFGGRIQFKGLAYAVYAAAQDMNNPKVFTSVDTYLAISPLQLPFQLQVAREQGSNPGLRNYYSTATLVPPKPSLYQWYARMKFRYVLANAPGQTLNSAAPNGFGQDKLVLHVIGVSETLPSYPAPGVLFSVPVPLNGTGGLAGLLPYMVTVDFETDIPLVYNTTGGAYGYPQLGFVLTGSVGVTEGTFLCSAALDSSFVCFVGKVLPGATTALVTDVDYGSLTALGEPYISQIQPSTNNFGSLFGNVEPYETDPNLGLLAVISTRTGHLMAEYARAIELLEYFDTQLNLVQNGILRGLQYKFGAGLTFDSIRNLASFFLTDSPLKGLGLSQSDYKLLFALLYKKFGVLLEMMSDAPILSNQMLEQFGSVTEGPC